MRRRAWSSWRPTVPSLAVPILLGADCGGDRSVYVPAADLCAEVQVRSPACGQGDPGCVRVYCRDIDEASDCMPELDQVRVVTGALEGIPAWCAEQDMEATFSAFECGDDDGTEVVIACRLR